MLIFIKTKISLNKYTTYFCYLLIHFIKFGNLHKEAYDVVTYVSYVFILILLSDS